MFFLVARQATEGHPEKCAVSSAEHLAPTNSLNQVLTEAATRIAADGLALATLLQDILLTGGEPDASAMNAEGAGNNGDGSFRSQSSVDGAGLRIQCLGCCFAESSIIVAHQATRQEHVWMIMAYVGIVDTFWGIVPGKIGVV